MCVWESVCVSKYISEFSLGKECVGINSSPMRNPDLWGLIFTSQLRQLPCKCWIPLLSPTSPLLVYLLLFIPPLLHRGLCFSFWVCYSATFDAAHQSFNPFSQQNPVCGAERLYICAVFSGRFKSSYRSVTSMLSFCLKLWIFKASLNQPRALSING